MTIDSSVKAKINNVKTFNNEDYQNLATLSLSYFLIICFIHHFLICRQWFTEIS